MQPALAQKNSGRAALRKNPVRIDTVSGWIERLRLMPNIEVGKGITFRPRNDRFEVTMRFRMQNLLAMNFDNDWTLTGTDARVKRLRLRFDGYIYSPKLVYSIQLGFTGYDAEPLPNGNMNIVRDAIVYYVPSEVWNIGFGQTKIKANRARINSSSALQFVDRSIVNSQFNLDRDFGFFGEYNPLRGDGFNLAAKASVTSGEGRNWGSSSNGGFAYTGRVELYPLGRFKAKGEVIEGNYEYEERVKMLLAGAYSYNDRTARLDGQRGALMPGGALRSMGAYFVDFISVFDLLYEPYAEARREFLKRHRRISEFDSENLTYALLERVLAADPAFRHLGVLCHQPLRQLIRDWTLLDDEERRYASNGATHLDFLIYNRVSKRPVLAVETDGYRFHKQGTRQSERDRMKDRILNRYGLPLLRLSTTGTDEEAKIQSLLKRN